MRENIRRKIGKWRSEMPNWCIYSDADEFPLTVEFGTLREFIEDRDKKGFNVIRQRIAYFYPTGKENFGLRDPRKIFNHYRIVKSVERIFKFKPEVKLSPTAHSVSRKKKIVSIESLKQPIFHYTLRRNWNKLAKQRLKRCLGGKELRRGLHIHYKRYVKRKGTVWSVKELEDLSNPKSELHAFYLGG